MAKEKPIQDEPQGERAMVRVENIAGLFGLSVEMIYRLTKEGIIHSEKVPGQHAKAYPLIETIKDYIAHLQKKIGGRGRAIDSLNVAKLRESELRQRQLGVKVMLAEGKAYPEEAVAAVMNDMLGSFRTRLRSMPQDVAPKLVGAPDTQTVTRILAEEIDLVCSLLSDYRREDFMTRNDQFMVEAEAGSEDDADDKENPPE